MIKIGIITFFTSDSNYGQLFQCWALQNFLESNGYQPFIIRYQPTHSPRNKFAILKRLLPYSSYSILRQITIHRANIFELFSTILKNRKREFNRFKKHYISFSSRIYRDLSEIQNDPPRANIYIAGSDQIWSQLLSDIDNQAYYLNFGDEEILRISYAPSFGMNSYPEPLIEDLKKNLKRFDYLSVREHSGVTICAKAGVRSIKVLDPTFLINRDQYKTLIADQSHIKNNYHSLFVYSLNISSPEEIRWTELKQYATKSSLTITITPASGHFNSSEIFGKERRYLYATPSQWLECIRDSKCVITPSFHGIVFSIIFHTPFVYIPLQGRYEGGNARIIEMLKDLHLENRILWSHQSYESIITSKISWDEVEMQLSKLVASSKDFLLSSLSSTSEL